MSGNAEPPDGNAPPECLEPGCGRDAAFWWYDRPDDEWSPVCDVHASHLHPSLEVGAWLESGYLRPVERGRPAGPPPRPDVDRGRVFREEIDALLGWSDDR